MPRKPVVVINPLFKLLLRINASLCIVALLGMVCLAIWGPDPLTKAQDRLLNACEHVFTMTAGAFIGLLGGRAAAPDSMDEGLGANVAQGKSVESSQRVPTKTLSPAAPIAPSEPDQG